MQLPAHQVRKGDTVRGLGLTVERVEIGADAVTHIAGRVTHANMMDPWGPAEQSEVAIELPSIALVGVDRSDANFRNDRLRELHEAFEHYRETFDYHQLVDDFLQIANMPREAEVDHAHALAVFNDLSDDQDLEWILNALDGVEQEEPVGL